MVITHDGGKLQFIQVSSPTVHSSALRTKKVYASNGDKSVWADDYIKPNEATKVANAAATQPREAPSPPKEPERVSGLNHSRSLCKNMLSVDNSQSSHSRLLLGHTFSRPLSCHSKATAAVPSARDPGLSFVTSPRRSHSPPQSSVAADTVDFLVAKLPSGRQVLVRVANPCDTAYLPDNRHDDWDIVMSHKHKKEVLMSHALNFNRFASRLCSGILLGKVILA